MYVCVLWTTREKTDKYFHLSELYDPYLMSRTVKKRQQKIEPKTLEPKIFLTRHILQT